MEEVASCIEAIRDKEDKVEDRETSRDKEGRNTLFFRMQVIYMRDQIFFLLNMGRGTQVF